MPNLIKGLKNTLISLAFISLLFFALINTQSHWLPWLSVLDALPYGLLILTALFAAQFNRSRFTLLASVWLVYYSHQAFDFAWSAWLVKNPDWQMLTGLWILALLSVIKDRGLLSIHGLSRIFFLFCCGGFAYRENGQLSRLLRDARAAHVMSPTTDILKLWSGRLLLDLPLI